MNMKKIDPEFTQSQILSLLEKKLQVYRTPDEDFKPSKTLTPAFDKQISEQNQRLSQDVLNIIRKPLKKNRRNF